jgi:small subunit ribosomal protein S3
LGQKVHPHGMRLGIIRDWDSQWYAERGTYADQLLEDVELRKFIKKRLYNTGIAQVQIERKANQINVTVHTARPGMVIGKGGSEVDALRKELETKFGKKIHLNIQEVRTPETSAQLVAENIAFQLERRTSFRRAMKQTISRSMRLGAQGIRVTVSGRLGGAEIARTEWASEGKVPLHTLRANIDYGFAEAATTYGKIGVKVWIYKGEILPERVETGDRRVEGGE